MGANKSRPASKDDTTEKPILPYGVTSTSSFIHLTSAYRSFYNGIVSLVEENKYSDLIIICGSDRYPVHRAIVCPRATWIMMKCEELADERPDVTPILCSIIFAALTDTNPASLAHQALG